MGCQVQEIVPVLGAEEPSSTSTTARRPADLSGENLEDEFEPFVHHCGILRALVWAFKMDKFVGCAQTTQIVSAGLQQEELRKLPVSLSLGTSRNVFQLLPEG